MTASNSDSADSWTLIDKLEAKETEQVIKVISKFYLM